MPGIYVHIPYCHKACHYCNFHFSTHLKTIDQTIKAICREAELVKADFAHIEFTTFYFGGGTPSLLTAEQLYTIMRSVRNNFNLSSQETTLEANPEDIVPEKLEHWLKSGFDRLSLGIQTFDDRFLKQFNRNHISQQAITAVEIARRTGFRKFNIDLIFGFPGQSLERWLDDLHRAIDLHPQHMSIYALTREEGTAFDYQVRKNILEEADEALLADMFYAAREMLTSAGYQHYETSNYALPGYEALHNSSYWRGEVYAGIGPSAHSYTGTHRRWNIANNALYEKALHHRQKWYEEEELTPEMRFNELIITGIRTARGIDIEGCLSLLEDERKPLWMKKVGQLIDIQRVSLSSGYLVIHPEYLFISDQIAVELML